MPVTLILKMLGLGISKDEILTDYPQLEPRDIEAAITASDCCSTSAPVRCSTNAASCDMPYDPCNRWFQIRGRKAYEICGQDIVSATYQL